jgi:hypothetical protein
MGIRLSIIMLGIAGLALPSFGAMELRADARRSLLGASGRDPGAGEPEASKAAVSDGTTVRFRAAGWFTSLDGQGSFGDAIPGTTTQIDLIDTLGLDEDKAVLSASAGINIGKSARWHIDGGFNGPFDYDGANGSVDISFNDLRFTGAIDSEAKLNIYEVNMAYDLVNAHPFTLSVGPGVRVFDLEATVRGTATDPNTNITQAREEVVDGIAPLPGLGIAARIDLTPNIYVRGSGRGMYAGGYGNFFDASAEAGYDLGKNLGLFAGYRWMHGEADVDDVEFEVNLRGLYAGVEVRF